MTRTAAGEPTFFMPAPTDTECRRSSRLRSFSTSSATSSITPTGTDQSPYPTPEGLREAINISNVPVLDADAREAQATRLREWDREAVLATMAADIKNAENEPYPFVSIGRILNTLYHGEKIL
jgi:hypothetical protein